jgi:hypothetical protein
VVPRSTTVGTTTLVPRGTKWYHVVPRGIPLHVTVVPRSTTWYHVVPRLHVKVFHCKRLLFKDLFFKKKKIQMQNYLINIRFENKTGNHFYMNGFII